MVILVGCGLFLTIFLKGIQFRGFIHALNVLRGKYDHPNDPGEISHFQALSTALSATIGTGNIVGWLPPVVVKLAKDYFARMKQAPGGQQGPGKQPSK